MFRSNASSCRSTLELFFVDEPLSFLTSLSYLRTFLILQFRSPSMLADSVSDLVSEIVMMEARECAGLLLASKERRLPSSAQVSGPVIDDPLSHSPCS